ncbi:AAA family ATPase [Spiroplasma sp. SV19]|uniref:AAA family ATPase n=1 Tax=Spiroplasma sp. SV19 TaxID=2570468 RepID=UPI0024B70F45|nr:AAA family ATPase [Spiroplasma sp. SV19]WHQ37055.1 AAA family ATPase [Spiroplasma sp. SV19]
MRYLQVKNYRSIEDGIFNFGNINFFIGDNNTGKTSILKLINAIHKNEYLNFNGTYLSEYLMNDFRINNKPIEVLYGTFQINDEDNNSNKNLKFPTFEFLTIDTVKDYDKPLIKKIVTNTDVEEDSAICEFSINYAFDSNKELNITKIIMKIFLYNMASLNFDSKDNNLDAINELKKIINDDKNCKYYKEIVLIIIKLIKLWLKILITILLMM